MKASAIDYLIEFINSENEDKWLQSVITCYINSNEEISESDKQILMYNLLSDKDGEFFLSSTEPNTGKSSLVNLMELHHKSGVNALADKQKINFSNEVTVLYGLNGSGKSSYFRILQAMIGNIDNSEIIPNIYLNMAQSVSVKLKYKLDSEIKKISWDNTNIINDLKTLKVFDSKYSKKFLDKKESDEQILYPYKLYVFSEVSKYIDEIKNLANKSLGERTKDNVFPRIDKFEEDEENYFDRELTEKDIEYFTSIATTFDENKANELIEKQKEIKSLTETNYSDKLKLLENRRLKFEETKSRVENILFTWLEKSKEFQKLFVQYKKYEQDVEEKKRQSELLSNLPGADSSEWGEFIKAGLSISKKSEYLENTCPYCQREYDEDALLIVQAYSGYIEDVASKRLKESKSKIQKYINEATSTEILKQDYLYEDDQDLKLSVTSLLERVIAYIDSLKNMKDSFENIEPIKFDTTIIKSKFSELEHSFKAQKDSYNNEESQKEKKLNNLKNLESDLIFQKQVHEKIDDITKYIQEDITIQVLRKRVRSITSHRISSISKTAHDELLSKQLMEKFDSLLEQLNIKGHDIELKTSTSKGAQQTELIMKAKNHVTKILSEGEQKAVSIALFLAEILVAQNNSTIILDDPVNSLDHTIIQSLVNILLRLPNQVIVFTHNVFFRDTISGNYLGHICKNFQSKGCTKDKGKHVFLYQIKSEGSNKKGIVTSNLKYNAKGYLEEAKASLSKSPFNEESHVCILLRTSIEHIIDEIVFNRQIPNTYHIKGVAASIQWNELKKMASDSQMIDNLRRIYDRVSSGALHSGQVSDNNPVDKQELLRFHEELEEILEIGTLNLQNMSEHS